MVISDEVTSASKVLVLKWSLTKMHSQIKICSKSVKSVAYDPDGPTGGTSETKTNSCADHTFVFHIQPETRVHTVLQNTKPACFSGSFNYIYINIKAIVKPM